MQIRDLKLTQRSTLLEQAANPWKTRMEIDMFNLTKNRLEEVREEVQPSSKSTRLKRNRFAGFSKALSSH